jgi:MFS family permease
LGPLLGISLGLGFPYSLSYLSDCTESEQRGRVSGIVLLQTFIMLAIGTLVDELMNSWLIGILIVLMIIRLTSFLAFFLDECIPCCESINERKIERRTWKDIVTYRRFVLYFVPWMLFIVASVIMEYIIWPQFKVNSNLKIAYQIGDPLHYVGTAICGIISGILADRVGRKTPTVIGLTLLGISFVILRFPIDVYTIFANLMAVGMAFGFLIVVSITVPGDLAFPKSKERFYALILVLPLSVYGGLGAIPRALNYTDSGEAISLILIILLFMLIIPVWMSEESLSSQKIKERKLREHMEKVKELVRND